MAINITREDQTFEELLAGAGGVNNSPYAPINEGAAWQNVKENISINQQLSGSVNTPANIIKSLNSYAENLGVNLSNYGKKSGGLIQGIIDFCMNNWKIIVFVLIIYSILPRKKR